MATKQIVIPELQTDFVFFEQPLSIPGDLRPAWRISLIVLLLFKCCRQGRTSLTRLHVLSWAFVDPSGRRQLLAATQRNLEPQHVLVRFEPFLLQAVDYAIGERLIRRIHGDTIEITEWGRILAAQLFSQEGLFAKEKEAIETLGFDVTENFVRNLFGKER